MSRAASCGKAIDGMMVGLVPWNSRGYFPALTGGHILLWGGPPLGTSCRMSPAHPEIFERDPKNVEATRLTLRVLQGIVGSAATC